MYNRRSLSKSRETTNNEMSPQISQVLSDWSRACLQGPLAKSCFIGREYPPVMRRHI